LGSLKIFAKKTRPSSNVVLTHCRSVTYYNGLKPHWRKMQKLSKNHFLIHSFKIHSLIHSKFNQKIMKKYFGPSTLVAAAFIGPGTLTTCTMAGVKTGYMLLWAMLFSIAATMILQEMSARLGFVTRKGLGEAIDAQFPKGAARFLVFFLVIGAILIGNAAYEAGNIAGGVLGLHLIVGEWKLLPLLLGGLSFLLLFFGKYKLVERTLIFLVILMSVCFLATAVIVRPDFLAIFRGFVPSGINEHFLLIMGLIGTTVVPYNLFLHASTISKKWSTDATIRDIRIENAVAILLGGLISMLIIITAAASQGAVESVSSAKDLAAQLEPLFGATAKWAMGLGLLAAGLSSTLTAPIAAAYAAQGLFGWEKNEKDAKFRAVWMLILGIGVFVAMTGLKPVLIIKFAQITNALLLPFIAMYLLYLSNSKKLLGTYTNSLFINVVAGLVIGITLMLSVKVLVGIF